MRERKPRSQTSLYDAGPPRWASRDETAEYLRVTTRSVDRYISDGMFPAHRIGNRLIRINLNEVDAAMRLLPTVGGDAA